MEFKFVAPIASAAAATPVGRLQPETATTSARPATRAVIIRMGDSLSRRKRVKRRAGTGGYYSFRARTRYRCERRIRTWRQRWGSPRAADLNVRWVLLLAASHPGDESESPGSEEEKRRRLGHGRRRRLTVDEIVHD